MKKIFFYCGFFMFLSEIWKQYTLTYIVNHGTYIWWYFPFQLCSIPMYICLLFPVISSERIQGIMLTFLMDFGLLGGIFAFFDTTGMYYGHTLLTLHSFAWHILLIVLGICAGLTGKADYSGKGYAGSAVLFLACCLLATCFNLAFYPFGKINMFYISPRYQMGQIVFRDIAEAFGNQAAIISYLLAILAGAGLLHLAWELRNGSHILLDSSLKASYNRIKNGGTHMITERLLRSPGFLYRVGSAYYYLGKWICRECTEVDAADCVTMYEMCRNGHEEPDTNMYFNKLRAYSDFALEVPCNPAKTKADMTALIDSLSDASLASLETQLEHFEEDYPKYCGL